MVSCDERRRERKSGVAGSTGVVQKHQVRHVGPNEAGHVVPSAVEQIKSEVLVKPGVAARFHGLHVAHLSGKNSTRSRAERAVVQRRKGRIDEEVLCTKLVSKHRRRRLSQHEENKQQHLFFFFFFFFFFEENRISASQKMSEPAMISSLYEREWRLCFCLS